MELLETEKVELFKELLTMLAEVSPFKTVNASPDLIKQLNEVREDGTVITDFHVTISKGSDVTEQEMFDLMTSDAIKNAKPLDFNDLRWKRADE